MQENTDQLYKALGNKERVQLIICLREEQTVTDLLSKCHLSQSALSQHLALLKQLHIVDCRRDGKHQFYKTIHSDTLNICLQLKELETKLFN